MSESPPAATARSWPSGVQVTMITAFAAVASVGVNAALVWIAKASDPGLQHYSHFRLWDFGTLTGVGVVGAGAAWYVATRYLAAPRQLFFRAAIAATLVLWVPDVWILIKHEPPRAVLFLALMHLTVALITYNLLVLAAPVRSGDASADVIEPQMRRVVNRDTDTESSRVSRAVWVALMLAVGVEFFAGIFSMLYVPFNRPDRWVVHRGETIYLFHALLGGVLGVAAIALVLHVSGQSATHRVDRVGAISGLCGMLVGALGGVLSVYHPLRLCGMALMFIGVSVAFFGYLIPMIDDAPPVAPTASTRTAGDQR